MLIPVIPAKRKSSLLPSEPTSSEVNMESSAPLLKPTLHVEVAVKAPMVKEVDVSKVSDPTSPDTMGVADLKAAAKRCEAVARQLLRHR